MVEFIKYDGKYPCLCDGVLSIKVDGKAYHLEGVLRSGGWVCFDDEWNADVTKGPWEVDLHDYRLTFPELEAYKEEIEKVVNENVEWGCCGGCV